MKIFKIKISGSNYYLGSNLVDGKEYEAIKLNSYYIITDNDLYVAVPICFCTELNEVVSNTSSNISLVGLLGAKPQNINIVF